MTAIAIRVENLDRIRESLRNSPTVSNPKIAAAINAGLVEIQKEAIDPNFQFKTPRSQRTGFLQKSFKNGFIYATPESLKGAVGPNIYYAILVHEGTAPHEIVIKNKKVLANKKLEQVFGKKVMHPGTKANPFMPRIADKAAPKVNDQFRKALNQITELLAK